MRQSLTKIELIREQQENMEQDILEEDNQESTKEWENERKSYSDGPNQGGRDGEFNGKVTSFPESGFICQMNSFPDNCPLDENLLTGTIPVEEMTTDEKIKYLYAILRKRQETSRIRLDQLFDDLEKLFADKETLEVANRAESLEDMKVIAMTITGASTNNSLLKMIDPEIVIVEEAAEVLEPQLLVALTANLKQLIMIGDHNQLPPQVRPFLLSFSALIA